MKKCQIVHLTGASCRATGEYVIVGENSSVSEALAAGQYFCHQHGQTLLKKTPGALLAHVDADSDRRVTTYTVAPESLDGHDSQTVKVMGEYGNGTKLPLRKVSTPEAFVGWQRMRYAEAKYTFFGEDWSELIGLSFFKEKFVEIIPQANGEPSKETALVKLSEAVNKQTEDALAEAAAKTLAQEETTKAPKPPKLSRASQEAWEAQSDATPVAPAQEAPVAITPPRKKTAKVTQLKPAKMQSETEEVATVAVIAPAQTPEPSKPEKAQKAEKAPAPEKAPKAPRLDTMEKQVAYLKALVAAGDDVIKEALRLREVSLREAGHRVIAPLRAFDDMTLREAYRVRYEAGEDAQTLADEAGVSLVTILDMKRQRATGGRYGKKSA